MAFNNAHQSSGSMIPGRSALKKRPVDPKSGQYERSRARDAYRKQLNVFKAKFEASLREHDRLDIDAKQEIRIKAKRQREICLKDYRENLQGLARTSVRRSYKDVFLGDCESSVDMYDPNILEYELRLTSEMDTIIDNIRILNADKSNVSKMDWFSNLARAKFSYEYEMQDEIDPDSLRIPKEPTPEPEPAARYEPDIDPELASIGSSAYVYKPFAKRINLYRDEDDSGPSYRFNWQRLYDSKPSRRTIPDYETESITDRFDYEPFQPFSDIPIGSRRNRYPDASVDPEWTSQSLVYSYHRPSQPSTRYTPQRLDTNLDSICPTYGYGQDDDQQSTCTTRGELMAGIDYEYKPIIPSYLRNNNADGPSSSRFNYNLDEDNDQQSTSERFRDLSLEPREPLRNRPSHVHFDDQTVLPDISSNNNHATTRSNTYDDDDEYDYTSKRIT